MVEDAFASGGLGGGGFGMEYLSASGTDSRADLQPGYFVDRGGGESGANGLSLLLFTGGWLARFCHHMGRASEESGGVSAVETSGPVVEPPSCSEAGDFFGRESCARLAEKTLADA